MSTILKTIKADLKEAMLREIQVKKSKNLDLEKEVMIKMAETIKTVCRSIISMYPEIGIKPDKASDDDTIKLVKKYISMEKTRELYVQKILTESDVEGLTSKELDALVSKKIEELGDKLSSLKIVCAYKYLPVVPSDDVVITWIKENVDFSQFKNKMQAMKLIMNEFKGIDGNTAKKILMNNF